MSLDFGTESGMKEEIVEPSHLDLFLVDFGLMAALSSPFLLTFGDKGQQLRWKAVDVSC